MHPFDFLDEIVLICASAIVVILIFQKLRIPAVLGLISTGLILGPTGVGLIYQHEVIETISELGIVLLLFTIGLEFSLEELRKLKRFVLAGGSMQVLVTIAVIAFVAGLLFPLFGFAITSTVAIFFGLVCSVSSTAICAKLLSDRRELELPHGRATIAILIFQDIAIVPLMIVVANMGTEGPGSWEVILLRLGSLVLIGIGLFGVFRFALPRLVNIVTSINAREVIILGAIVLCFGAAYLTSLADMSMGLGAFIAGVIIAGTNEGHKLGRAIEPMRDAFTGIFFISVGLLLDMGLGSLMPYVGIAVALMLIKSVIVTAVLVLLRTPIRVAIMSGIILAQVGEFAFVLAEAGWSAGIVERDMFQGILAIIIVTMAVTPVLFSIAPRFAGAASPAFQFVPLRPVKGAVPTGVRSQADPVQHDVCLIGFGVIGQNVSRVLKSTQISYRVLDLNAESASRYRKAGEPMIAGDSTDMRSLQALGIEHARAVIIAISDHTAISRTIKLIRILRPDIFIVARTRYAIAVDTLVNAGADVVVTEEYESSIQVFIALLEYMGIDKAMILQQEEIIRNDRYGVLARLQDQQTAVDDGGV